MAISPPKGEAKVKVVVDKDPVAVILKIYPVKSSARTSVI